MRNIIAQGVVSRVYKIFAGSSGGEYIKLILSITMERKALYNRFRTVCNRALSTRQKSGREIYFDEVVYTTASWSLRFSVPTEVGSMKIKKIEDM